MYTYIYLYIYTHIYLYKYILRYIHTYIHVYVYVSIYIHIYTGLGAVATMMFEFETNKSQLPEVIDDAMDCASKEMTPEVVQRTATYCNTLEHTATHCNTQEPTPRRHRRRNGLRLEGKDSPGSTTYCNTLQHTATHCNTLQHTATHCNTLQHTATTHCNTLQSQLSSQYSMWFADLWRTTTRLVPSKTQPRSPTSAFNNLIVETLPFRGYMSSRWTLYIGALFGCDAVQSARLPTSVSISFIVERLLLRVSIYEAATRCRLCKVRAYRQAPLAAPS